MSQHSNNLIILIWLYYKCFMLSIGLSVRRKIALHVSFFKLGYYAIRIIPFFIANLNRNFIKPVLKYFLLERTETGAFQFV